MSILSKPPEPKLSSGERLENGPLGHIGTLYVERLRSQRYAESTICGYVAAVLHIALWAKRNAMDITDVDARAFERFSSTHLRACKCKPKRQRGLTQSRAAHKHLLACLRKLEVDTHPRTAVAAEMHEFSFYLSNVCGAAPLTREFRVKHVDNFLGGLFGEKSVDVSKISPKHIDDFMATLGKTWSASSLGGIRSSLRSYLRFRALQGDDVQALTATIPVLANWKKQKPPKSLTASQRQSFLGAFDRSNPTQQRDYAIARCLLDLGLRGHEVAALSLDAIDWRQGAITVRGSKTRRTKQLPLPWDTGEAIARYVRGGRPQTSNRALFVRHVAPYDKPLKVDAIRSSMNRAFVRCGLADSFCNTHVLRHTLAIQLQSAGSSIKQIADVLRHDSIESTQSYTRADISALRTAALAWPGRES